MVAVTNKHSLLRAPSPLRTIHLHQEFRLDAAAGLMLLSSAPFGTDGVDLVYKDGTGCVEPSLEQRLAIVQNYTANPLVVIQF